MIALLIRHGHCDAVGRWLAGRSPGLSLNDTGRREARALRDAMCWTPLAAIYSSPLERALETAAPIADDHGLPITTREALTDIDFGAWTGMTLDALGGVPEWEAFNRHRNDARAPGGESLAALQDRVVEDLVVLSRRHERDIVAIVTHAELIRCAIAAFSGQSLDAVAAIDIAPAHVSAVGLRPRCRRVLSINQRADLLAV